MDKEFIDNIRLELLNKADEIYGEKVDKIWFYDGKICPFCNKREIDALKMGEESALSLNAYMYHEMNTLIGYFFYRRCITDLLGNTVQQKSNYEKLEQNLKNAYRDHLKLSAS